jgi:hypothetical protein
MGIRLVLLVFLFGLRLFAQPFTQPPFQLQLLGVDPATNKLIIINVDSRSIVIDRMSSPTPTLVCANPGFLTGGGLFLDRRTSPPTLTALLSQISPPSVTYRVVFTFNQTTNLWTAPALFTATPPNLTTLIQVHRNGAFVDSDIAGIAYTPPAAGSPPGLQGVLEIKTVSVWPTTDTVTAVWVFPLL